MILQPEDSVKEEGETKPEPGAEGEEEEKKEVEEEEDLTPRPRALHKTASIFLRNLAPTITKQEVEAVSHSLQFYNKLYIF